MANSFPKTLHVKFEDGGTGPDYLLPSRDIADLVATGETVRVGVYRLVEIKEAGGIVVTKTVRKVK